MGKSLGSLKEEIEQHLLWVKTFMVEVDQNSRWHQELSEQKRSFLSCSRRIVVFEKKPSGLENKELLNDIIATCEDTLKRFFIFKERYNRLFGKNS